MTLQERQEALIAAIDEFARAAFAAGVEAHARFVEIGGDAAVPRTPVANDDRGSFLFGFDVGCRLTEFDAKARADEESLRRWLQNLKIDQAH